MTKRKSRRALMCNSALVGALCVTLMAGQAFAQTTTYTFDIKSKSLAQALHDVAMVSRQQIIFTPDQVAGRSAPVLEGRYTAEEALSHLLVGTDLEVDRSSTAGLMVQSKNVQAASNEAADTPVGGAENPIEQVVVSASRLAIAGYQAPTPVTTIGEAQLQADAHTDIGDSIRELPALGASIGPENGSNGLSAGNTAEDLVNLRNLGILRTLVLVDGQRVVNSNITGGVDLSTIPTALVQRIDVVTGGASASWGSDAVAGVVNLVLNKNFNGFKADIEGADTSVGDLPSWKLQASYGTSFFNDRLHLVVSGVYQDSPGVIFPSQRSWFNDTQLVTNPAYTVNNSQPQLIHANNVGFSQATQGGVIVSNPAGTINGVTVPGSANAFANIQFVGNGTPATFSPGNISGLYAYGGNADTLNGSTESPLTSPYRNETFFGYASYKITPDIQASVQLNYGKSDIIGFATDAVKYGTLTMQSDNAYLDPSIAARMAALGVTSFNFGTTNTNNVSANNLSLQSLESSVGYPESHDNRQLYRGVFSLDGSLSDDWSWNAYYQHGESRVRLTTINDLYTPNYLLAIDAVRVTTANRGTSGLAINSVACRSTLTNPTNGCVPLDVFGNNVASAAAIGYVNGVPNFSEIIDTQDAAAGSVQGKLPWALPAGSIPVTFGVEYRKEAGVNTTDAAAIAASFQVGNFKPFKGEYNVIEGFAETDLPILKDNLVQSLDINAAGRMTSYSTSGLVETWKLGLTSQVNDDLRLRSTWSYDIRAPDLAELYASGASTAARGVDPHTGLQVNYFSVAIGNTALTPEKSTTVSGGVVVTPHWFPGLNFSLDWYSINIKSAIYSTPAATEAAQCAAGVAVYCTAVLFNGPNGALSQVIVEPLNAAAATTSGLDFQADYSHELFGGNLDLRAMSNYMDEETQTALGVKTDYAGSEGGDALVPGGVPKFKGTVTGTYAEGPWSGTVQGRFIGAGDLVNGWSAKNVDNNNVPFVAYMDLRGSYSWNEHLQIYGAMDNVFNTPPPDVATSQIQGELAVATVTNVYDAIGRQYRVGVRLNF